MLGISKGFLYKFALTVASVTFIASNADASGSPFMKIGKLTSIPIGHYMFCKENPSECNTATKADVRVQLNANNWRSLLDVNHQVNSTVAAVTDVELYGQEEVWTYPSFAGDCEDYVLQKRRNLMAQGWPAGALLITVVLQPNGEGHAVLTVRTDRGDLVLDNLENDVKLWSDTPYTYLKRQSKNHTGKWESINDQPVAAVGSLTN